MGVTRCFSALSFRFGPLHVPSGQVCCQKHRGLGGKVFTQHVKRCSSRNHDTTIPCNLNSSDADTTKLSLHCTSPRARPSRGRNVVVYVKDTGRHKPAELAYSFLFCSCVYFCLYGPSKCISFHKFSLALSNVFHSIHSPDNSPLSHSVLPVVSLPYWSFLLYISLFMKVSLCPDIILCG